MFLTISDYLKQVLFQSSPKLKVLPSLISSFISKMAFTAKHVCNFCDAVAQSWPLKINCIDQCVVPHIVLQHEIHAAQKLTDNHDDDCNQCSWLKNISKQCIHHFFATSMKGAMTPRLPHNSNHFVLEKAPIFMLICELQKPPNLYAQWWDARSFWSTIPNHHYLILHCRQEEESWLRQ